MAKLLLAASLALAAIPAFGAARPGEEELMDARAKLEKMLTENIIPFWHPGVIDRDNGGYKLNHDEAGRWMGPSDKYLVTQARTVWFFSRLARSKYGSEEHLRAARAGYEFLRDKMWDGEFGGFYWAVSYAGDRPTMPDKHLYGQSFALYALSQYAMASGDPEAEQLARRLFRLIDFHAHDPSNGGYVESFSRDWKPLPRGRKGYMGVGSDVKLMNTHLHLMEALTAYYLATRDLVARKRLLELIFIQSNSVVRKTVGACTDKHTLNWLPLRGPEYDRVSYGHDLENVWLLMEACRAVGLPPNILLDLYRRLFDYSLRYGFDREGGGFFSSGPIGRPADDRRKIWWVQAECMVSSLMMYRLTRDPLYFGLFRRTLDWILENQVDWENGDWHAEVGEDGRSGGRKAGPWKSPYHNGRAVLKCIELLDELMCESHSP